MGSGGTPAETFFKVRERRISTSRSSRISRWPKQRLCNSGRSSSTSSTRRSLIIRAQLRRSLPQRPRRWFRTLLLGPHTERFLPPVLRQLFNASRARFSWQRNSLSEVPKTTDLEQRNANQRCLASL